MITGDRSPPSISVAATVADLTAARQVPRFRQRIGGSPDTAISNQIIHLYEGLGGPFDR